MTPTEHAARQMEEEGKWTTENHVEDGYRSSGKLKWDWKSGTTGPHGFSMLIVRCW